MLHDLLKRFGEPRTLRAEDDTLAGRPSAFRNWNGSSESGLKRTGLRKVDIKVDVSTSATANAVGPAAEVRCARC